MQVVCTLVTEALVNVRVALLKKLLRLGECFIELRNYDGAFAVWFALNTASVSRLKLMWKTLDKGIEVRCLRRHRVALFCVIALHCFASSHRTVLRHRIALFSSSRRRRIALLFASSPHR